MATGRQDWMGLQSGHSAQLRPRTRGLHGRQLDSSQNGLCAPLDPRGMVSRLSRQPSSATQERLPADRRGDAEIEPAKIEATIQYVTQATGAGVGGPVDVVSITKEDGLVWIKRKNKIDEQLNPRIHKIPRPEARNI